MLACALRLWKIFDVPGNPFYDAAVRSMGASWHNFFFGALEPSGTVSVDKPPVDLWLQVATPVHSGSASSDCTSPRSLAGSRLRFALRCPATTVWVRGGVAGRARACSATRVGADRA